MPRRRNNKAANQKIAIKARLLVMREALDNYVSRGKPISVEEAAGYLDEIVGFNTKYIGEAWALQLITMISRCMKNIINGQESACSEMELSQSTDDTNISQSPVNFSSDVDFSKYPHNITKDIQNVPQATQNMPTAIPNIQKANQNIRKAATNIPKPTQNIPKTAPNIPKPTQNVPKAAPNIPKPTQNVPKAAPNIPKLTQNVPKTAPNIPKATRNIPKAPMNIPKATQNILNATQYDKKAAQKNHFEVTNENNFDKDFNLDKGLRNDIPIVQDISVESKTANNGFSVIPSNHKKSTKPINNTAVEPNKRTINKNIEEEVIDLCENENNITNTQKYIDVEMKRAFSDLSLKETEPMSIDFACSQSILEDYTQFNTTCIPEIGHEKYGYDNCKEKHVFKKPVVPEKSLQTQREYPRKELGDVDFSNKENNNRKANETDVSDSKLKKRKTKIADFLVENNRNKLQKRTYTDSEIPKKKRNKNPTKRTTKRKTKNVDVGKIVTQDIRSFFGVQKNNENQSLAKSMHPVQEPKSTTVKNTVNVEKPLIYTGNVCDDLSWMENLRFVKEIAADETDPNLSSLEDTFWDNSMLPFLEEQDFTLY